MERQTREIDIKGWWDKSTIAILLLHTESHDALVLIKKILSGIERNYGDPVRGNEKASITIFAFPSAQELKDDSQGAKEQKERENSKPTKKKMGQALKEMFQGLLVALPLQLLAYHIAVLRGCDVYQPRNLAKGATVE